MKIRVILILTPLLIVSICSFSQAQLGLWASPAELATRPMSGAPWEWVKNAADAANPDSANVSDQDSNNNVEILAAAIVYARTGIQSYKDKVVSAIKKLIHEGKPSEPSADCLAWARETGAYALAADLIEYRTPEFKTWLRNIVEIWRTDTNETLLEMYKRRPNNHGTQAFGCLVSVYAYLQDIVRLNEVRDYWIKGILGTNPGYTYGGPNNDLSWQADTTNFFQINPKGAMKKGLNIDGIMPDDMRRNGSFSNPPPSKTTSYHWEALQGIVMAARVLGRIGKPIWDVGDSAIYRAFHVLEVRWEEKYGDWAAEGDDEWMLPFIDAAYGSSFSKDQKRLWDHGKNAGWPYVVWKRTARVKEPNGTAIPQKYDSLQNYLNPFNSFTKIRYHLSQYNYVRLAIYDGMGQKLSVLLNSSQSPGVYTKVWEARDFNKQPVSSAIYFCRVQLG